LHGEQVGGQVLQLEQPRFVTELAIEVPEVPVVQVQGYRTEVLGSQEIIKGPNELSGLREGRMSNEDYNGRIALLGIDFMSTFVSENV